MKVILIEDVKGTGKKDNIKEVKDGFGSFLIKNKKAVPYSEKSKEVLSTQIKDRQDKENELIASCEKLKKEIESLQIKIPVKTGKQGKVFGSISSKQISEELKKKNITIDKKIIEAENINVLGVHLVKIKLHKKVTAELRVILEGGD